ncbi:MAG TPA: polyphosphate kinase 1 [Candidatus Limnocylindrales bacterium]|nr:polyphosphate kinase 1 [Candidatus Limnocylindrales bacterium]
MAAVDPGPPAPTTVGARPRQVAKREAPQFPYLNRELSWLEFNARVLYEARDARNPLLERVKFSAIFAGNLDEFFQVRIAGLRQQVDAGTGTRAPDGRTPAEQLAHAREGVLELVAEHSAIFLELRQSLDAEGVSILDYATIPEHHEALRQRFLDEIFPVLTPLAVDPGHPFPYISTLSLSIAVGLRDPETNERVFARVKVPQILPRLLEVEPNKFIPIDQVIEANLEFLFTGMEVVDSHLFRVTRNADFTVEEDEADDLLMAIEEELRRRRFGEAVRLEVERTMPAATRNLLLRGLGLEADDCYEITGMLDLTALYRIADLDIPELRAAPWTPVTPPRLVPPDDDEPADVFAAVRAGDILVHHPYESFAASVERFIAQAADDPDVLTIKMTLYRTSGDSPIVQSLIRAAERGKQVVVLVEIKARFDEEANIIWARKLERAGAHVVYGLVGLKTHSKTALVVRREGSGLRRYVHIGTGNYNPKTARLYTDLGLLTVRPEIGADVTDLFNVLTGLSRQRTFRRLLVAPHSLRSGFLALVEREIAHAAAGRPAHITLKLNAIVDTPVIEALYRAAGAGVDIDLIVRGACSLQPGIPGVSDRVRVRSIIGEFLEHSRIWGFANGGDQEWYIGSADLMDRNLDRRVEAVVPVEDSDAKARIAEIIELMLADDRRSWQLQPDARWVRTETLNGKPGTVDTFETLKEWAVMSGHVASVPRRPGSGAGSLDPRA